MKDKTVNIVPAKEVEKYWKKREKSFEFKKTYVLTYLEIDVIKDKKIKSAIEELYWMIKGRAK